MKPLPVLLTAVLLSLCVTACAGTSKHTGSTSRAPENASTAGSTARTASTAQTGSHPQDDNHISIYGHQATEPDKRAITALVNRYYVAAAADDGAAACSLIYSTLAKSVPEDYGQPPGLPTLRGKTCPVVMSKVFKHVPRQSTADFATTKVTGIRLNGEHGFVQLSSRTIPTGELFVEREGGSGSWKVGALIGKACAKCSAG